MVRRTSLLLSLAGLAAAAVFCWHVVFTIGLKREFDRRRSRPELRQMEATMKVDPLTNIVTVTVAQQPPATDSPLEILGIKVRGGIVAAVAPAFLEGEINAAARDYLDLYGLLFPYRVRVVNVTGGSP